MLRILAIEHWDPLGVYDDPANADAYDAYLDRVGRMLSRGKGSAEIARYLGEVRRRCSPAGRTRTWTSFADRVVAWYGLEAPKA